MTTNPLTPGKRRGLSAGSTPAGIFTILAFDHRQSFVKMLNPDAPESVAYHEVSSAKSAVVRVLAPHASAVLLDPLYGAAQTIVDGALPGQTGLLVALEKTGYSGPSTRRVTQILPDWSVRKIKRLGADAVKFLLYYHPDSGEIAERQEQLTSQVIAACQEDDIPLFLEVVSYSINPISEKKFSEFAAIRPQLICRIARRLGALGPDVLKLEFPVDAAYQDDEALWSEACRAVSEASPVPWTVLSAGVEFDTFTRQVAVACRAGASGYIAGRAVWKEAFKLPSTERAGWLETVAARRLDALTGIAAQYARPWTDVYPPEDIGAFDGWFRKYGNRR